MTRPRIKSRQILPAPCRMRMAVAFALCAWSCGASKPILHAPRDPSFTPASLGQGQVAVAGVTSKLGSEIDRATVRNQLAGILASELEFNLRGLRVMPVDVARSRLGRDRHARLLADLEETGHVSAAAIAQLDSAIGAEVRYVVVARVETEKVGREEGTTGARYTPAIPEAGVEESYEEGDPQRSTRRTLDVSFLVYELSNGQAVWDELIRGTDIETATGSWTKKKTTYPVYPKAPKLEGAFDDACRTLAKHMAIPPK